jgi:POT family proton-dependent oligopeptide transporter
MKKIILHSHNTYTYIYAGSLLIERAAYYGLRSVLVLYLVSETLNMSQQEALNIYAWFTGLLIAGKVLGGVIGDLVTGNKNAIITGGVLQAVGAFILCLYSTTGLYIGLALVIFGGGLYSPNLNARFGKLYLKKPELLDAGFTILYLAVIIGSITGVPVIGYIGEEYEWMYGFIIAGLLMLGSVVFLLFSRDKERNLLNGRNFSFSSSLIVILFVLFISGLFWAVQELAYPGIRNIISGFQGLDYVDIPRSFWSALDSIFVVPLSVLAIVLWSYYYQNRFVKLSMGFISGAIGLGILLVAPAYQGESFILIFALSAFMLSLSEIYFAPTIQSLVVRYTNPKYLATVMGLISVPGRLFIVLTASIATDLDNKPGFALTIGVVLMAILFVIVLVFMKAGKNIIGREV